VFKIKIKFELEPYHDEVNEQGIVLDLKNVAHRLKKDSVTQ